MTNNRARVIAPAWMSDVRIRRAIAEQIKQRRAKRQRALAAFEKAVRLAEQGEPVADH